MEHDIRISVTYNLASTTYQLIIEGQVEYHRRDNYKEFLKRSKGVIDLYITQQRDGFPEPLWMAFYGRIIKELPELKWKKRQPLPEKVLLETGDLILEFHYVRDGRVQCFALHEGRDLDVPEDFTHFLPVIVELVKRGRPCCFPNDRWEMYRRNVEFRFDNHTFIHEQLSDTEHALYADEVDGYPRFSLGFQYLEDCTVRCTACIEDKKLDVTGQWEEFLYEVHWTYTEKNTRRRSK
jgi:hypothetical protein